MRAALPSLILAAGLGLLTPQLAPADTDRPPDYGFELRAAGQLAARIRPLWIDAVIAAEDPLFRSHTPAASPITGYAARLLVAAADPGLSQTSQGARHIHAIMSLGTMANHDEIICLVLRYGSFGRGLLGHDNAARYYFRKGADELTPAEIATLASLLKAPVQVFGDHDRALRRRDHVLKQMHLAGALSDDALTAALAEPLTLPR